jgi:hypothetical protein
VRYLRQVEQRQGTFGIVQGIFGIVQGTFGIVQGTLLHKHQLISLNSIAVVIIAFPPLSIPKERREESNNGQGHTHQTNQMVLVQQCSLNDAKCSLNEQFQMFPEWFARLNNNLRQP